MLMAQNNSRPPGPRLDTQDGVVEFDLDPEEDTKPCDVQARLAIEAEIIRAISTVEEATISRISDALDRMGMFADTVDRKGWFDASDYVRSRAWALLDA